MYYDYYSFFVQDVESAPLKTRQALVKVLQEIDAAILLSDLPKLKKLSGFKKVCYIKIGSYKLCIYKEKDKLSLARLLSSEELEHLLPHQKEDTPPSSLPIITATNPVIKRTSRTRKTVATAKPSPRTRKTPPTKQ